MGVGQREVVGKDPHHGENVPPSLTRDLQFGFHLTCVPRRLGQGNQCPDPASEGSYCIPTSPTPRTPGLLPWGYTNRKWDLQDQEVSHSVPVHPPSSSSGSPVKPPDHLSPGPSDS